MNIFADVSKELKEQDKIQLRQKLIAQFRLNSVTSLNQESPFFTPLLFDQNVAGQKNCENLVGQISIPVGVAGPISASLKINNIVTKLENLLIPLATTEGALVASINRGAKLLNLLNPMVEVKNVGMTRAPVFKCSSKVSAKKLVTWINNHTDELAEIGESTSSHLTFLSCQLIQKDNLVFARFAFDTEEAMGMNMVTIATDKIASAIIKNNPEVTCPALSSNVCVDKKTSSLNRKLGRGRWVTVTTSISRDLVESILKTTVVKLLETYEVKIVIGSKVAGLAGRNMQLANVASAILAATGQDIAHTVDISQGTLTLKKDGEEIKAKLSLPSVPVGTIGGGTNLETQRTARNLISNQVVTSNVLASTIALACLAAELSGLAALSTNTLSSSHAKLAR